MTPRKKKPVVTDVGLVQYAAPVVPPQPVDLPVSVPTPIEVIKGVNVARRKLFESSTTTEGWPINMLIAINAAKQLGIALFEIALSGHPARAKRVVSMFSFLGEQPSEPWREGVSNGEACIVTVYAVVVE